MLHMVNVNFFIKTMVILTILISTAIYYFIQFFILAEYEAYKVVSISSAVAAVLGLALTAPAIYRPVWRLFRRWKITQIQDLNGTWSGTISPSEGSSIEVKAIIRQSIFSTQLDMHGRTMKSITLTASAIVESGQYKVYYVYRAEPKKPEWPSYNGTTRFTLRILSDDKKESLALSGQYYTDRDTCGTIELTQTGNDPTVDVSYY